MIKFGKRTKAKSFDSYSKKRVSYILVTKDRARLFEETIKRGAKDLVKVNDELIVIDGSSTDKTLKAINKYKRFIHKYISESDLMPSHAGNKGLLIAQGKYIKMLTDDDIVYPDAMEKAIAIMESHPEIDILECGGSRYRKSTRTWETVYRDPKNNYPSKVNDAFKHGINVMGLIIRRKSLAKIGLFPISLLADPVFFINCILNKATIKFCRIKLYHQTIYDFSINEARRTELATLFYKTVKTYASKKFFF